MRWSQYFVPTLREDPADAEVISHKLLLRAGVVRQLSAGIYSYLPLGQRIALKVMQILREEMNRIGGQEFYLPALHPAEVWQESGRWSAIGDDHVPPERSQRRGHVPGHDARRGLYHDRAQVNFVLTSSCRRSGIRFRSSFATSRGQSRA